MKKLLSLIALGLMFGLCMYAQVPKADLFVGYSLVRYNSAQAVPAFTANGGHGAFTWNFGPMFGFEAEIGGHHNGNINNNELDTTTWSYLFGPRVSFKRGKTVVPYMHALFGGEDLSTSICCLVPTTGTGTSGTGTRVSHDQNHFAMAIGGGLDIKMGKHLMIRPIQLDYYLTRYEAQQFEPNLVPPLSGPSSNRNQNNLRYGAGIVFNFGGS